MKVLKKERVELGKGHILQYILFEWKKLGGIWFYHWKTIDQNRFHTHAFSSIAITLSGSYTQEVMENGVVRTEVVKKLFRPRYLPKRYCHRILKAEPNTWTMVIFGKWIPNWWEYFPDTKTWVKYSWGRKVVNKVKGEVNNWI
ncbi:hypothetical protein Phi4:1_gp026 [Cellulophaga phage phi4:1]|uniref:Cupin n=5 Tax=Lightbulbvirus TaxID=1918522 RepID=A0A0S2MWD6_9CAUD|nr:cysteine dioxygenase [Cellulophaga phage phi4:1]YP_008241521.1 cysteine dioxygenase [Cellulophaga phage phi17:2]ALO80035.1 hypothetical protein Phi4113_026 [Cellulophaga phage phi4:1_13]ALO80232.1 hypothetical protein Phi4118_026 [Cellulophaga phage phi4:1_18]ALO80429.1 hypothetical protein Phi17218_026 [Cellulophaga phage phi17:2_18]AGO47559.1 hypothetical protein Phi17:2_gp026 [Cellulophaga phage phi17:2]AGO49439.1 hypothetical protein Phi4:1_gp026 [Cellulophaga phage phi4:1]